ncbi:MULTISPECIES: hypothetical protein [Niastella]|uniref:Lipocalin-like domain-containing protein n=1 Tax=Niastella soli TaxID=2821487 RepID=A0ABS3Z1G0_9BACT|nr:hypothetical protein [Niastella soli]MBO9203988.1 hypothetical protein [Niastella soli]
MKTPPCTLALALTLSVFALACNKSNTVNNITVDNKKAPTLPEKLQGKWYQTDSHWTLSFNGNVINDAAIFSKGENTLEFRGNRITSEDRQSSATINYKVIEGPTNLLIANGDTTEIIKINDSELTLHWIDRTIPGNVQDQTDNFKKY